MWDLFLYFQSCSEVKQEEEKTSSAWTGVANISYKVFWNYSSVSATMSTMFTTKFFKGPAPWDGQGKIKKSSVVQVVYRFFHNSVYVCVWIGNLEYLAVLLAQWLML